MRNFGSVVRGITRLFVNLLFIPVFAASFFIAAQISDWLTPYADYKEHNYFLVLVHDNEKLGVAGLPESHNFEAGKLVTNVTNGTKEIKYDKLNYDGTKVIGTTTYSYNVIPVRGGGVHIWFKHEINSFVYEVHGTSVRPISSKVIGGWQVILSAVSSAALRRKGDRFI